jgi:hypothetical protein
MSIVNNYKDNILYFYVDVPAPLAHSFAQDLEEKGAFRCYLK